MIPNTAFHATRYADWTDKPLAYLPAYRPTYAQSAPLPTPLRMRSIGRASVRVPLCKRYTVVDCHGIGAEVYAAPRGTLTPLHTEWQAEVLSAIRMMRRWQYYSDTATAPALPNMPLDGCRCRVCVLRE